METERFLKDVEPLLSDEERERLVAFLGANPEAGKTVPETGGVKKVRWALAGRGKRGGARVIYYYHSERLPLFLLMRNWEQGRSRPDAPTRVLLAVIARHPEAVEDVLRAAS